MNLPSGNTKSFRKFNSEMGEEKLKLSRFKGRERGERKRERDGEILRMWKQIIWTTFEREIFAKRSRKQSSWSREYN